MIIDIKLKPSKWFKVSNGIVINLFYALNIINFAYIAVIFVSENTETIAAKLVQTTEK